MLRVAGAHVCEPRGSPFVPSCLGRLSDHEPPTPPSTCLLTSRRRFHHGALFLGHVLNKIRRLLIAPAPAERLAARTELIEQRAPLMSAVPRQGAVCEHLSEDDGVPCFGVDLDDLILELLVQEHAARAAIVGLVAARHDGESPVPRSFVGQHVLQHREAREDAVIADKIDAR